MMSSLTAHKLLVASSVQISGRGTYQSAPETALGWGMTEPMIKRWFIRQGFRGDGDRCAWKRWLSDWIESGQAVKFIREEDGVTGIWWTEIGPENYTRITLDAERMEIDHFYQGDGGLYLTTARKLGVVP